MAPRGYVSGMNDDPHDPQDQAESYDEERTGATDAVTSEQAEVDLPPERPRGIPFADADVTEESLADRIAQEQPDVSPADIDVGDADRVPGDSAIDLDQIAEPD